MCLPSAAAVAEMDLMELTVCAENHNIEGWEDFETADDFRDAIFKLMEKTQKPKARKKFQLTVRLESSTRHAVVYCTVR